MKKIALVGCGVMGRRHIRGFEKLRSAHLERFELVAVCDVYEPNAVLAADLARDLLGTEPRRFSSVTEAHMAYPDLDALIVTTAPDTHAAIGIDAMERGLHVLVEKPIAVTVSQGIALVGAAARTARILAVAENYRRDPVNRLAKALIDSGVLGAIYLIVQSSSGSGERVIITPWRHRRQSGGIVVDMGIHYADLFEYFLGPVETVFGMNNIVDRQRVDAEAVWHDVDAEDLSVGVARFASGAIGNLLIDLGGRGEGHFTRVVHGTGGSLAIPQDRTGRAPRLALRKGGVDESVDEADLLNLVPDFRLDDVTAALFGGERLTSFDLPFADIDANLLAIEQADFADAIVQGRTPEVDGAFGLRSLAIAYGLLESERLGRPAVVSDLIRNEDTPYQTEIDEALTRT